MKPQRIRWRMTPGDLDRLCKRLRPIRTRREVAGMLGVSQATICQLEGSALAKVMRALIRHDRHGDIESDEEGEIQLNGKSNHE